MFTYTMTKNDADSSIGSPRIVEGFGKHDFVPRIRASRGARPRRKSYEPTVSTRNQDAVDVGLRPGVSLRTPVL